MSAVQNGVATTKSLADKYNRNIRISFLLALVFLVDAIGHLALQRIHAFGIVPPLAAVFVGRSIKQDCDQLDSIAPGNVRNWMRPFAYVIIGAGVIIAVLVVISYFGAR